MWLQIISQVKMSKSFSQKLCPCNSHSCIRFPDNRLLFHHNCLLEMILKALLLMLIPTLSLTYCLVVKVLPPNFIFNFNDLPSSFSFSFFLRFFFLGDSASTIPSLSVTSRFLLCFLCLCLCFFLGELDSSVMSTAGESSDLSETCLKLVSGAWSRAFSYSADTDYCSHKVEISFMV